MFALEISRNVGAMGSTLNVEFIDIDVNLCTLNFLQVPEVFVFSLFFNKQ